MPSKEDLLSELAQAEHTDFNDTEFCEWLIETAQNLTYQPRTTMPGQLQFTYKTESHY